MIHRYIYNVLFGEKFEWQVSLSPEQLVEKLRGKNEGSFFERMFVPGVSVRIWGQRFSFSNMSIGKLPMSGNAFTHVLAGKIEKTSYGSKVKARFRLPIYVLIFSSIWLTAAFGAGLTIFFTGIQQAFETENFNRVWPSLIGLVFPLFGLIMLMAFRKLGSKNETDILQKISEVMSQYKV